MKQIIKSSTIHGNIAPFATDSFGGKSNRFHANARAEVHAADTARLGAAVKDILAEAGVRVLRWSDLDGARERFAAQRLLEFALREMRAGALRVEVEVWDARSMPGPAATDRDPSPEGGASPHRVASALGQLAGLFAGLVSFSYEKRDEYSAWLRRSGPQCALYSNEVAEFLPSKVSVERFQVLRHFLDLCGAQGIGVSMEGARGLATSPLEVQSRDAPFQISFKVD